MNDLVNRLLSKSNHLLQNAILFEDGVTIEQLEKSIENVSDSLDLLTQSKVLLRHESEENSKK